eukprot:COSAG03_NODE_12058_length_563_cov_1.286638_1_plen_69_part_10
MNLDSSVLHCLALQILDEHLEQRELCLRLDRHDRRLPSVGAKITGRAVWTRHIRRAPEAPGAGGRAGER